MYNLKTKLLKTRHLKFVCTYELKTKLDILIQLLQVHYKVINIHLYCNF